MRIRSSQFTAKNFFLACSVFFFVAVLFACSNNNAATSADGSTSANASTTGTGADMYYEYTTTSVGKNMNMSGYTKLYISAGGNVRSEMDLSNAAVKTDRSGPIVLITSKDKPNQSIFIDDAKKTYSVNIIDTSGNATGAGDDPFKMVSTVTKVGEEKIMGFNSVHARIISTKHMGPLGNMTDTIDLWNSPDVPLAPFFRHYMDKNMSKSWTILMTPAAVDQIKQMGCTGFMLK
ncbi:DUF4412 domain-containing protein, partial [Puia sp.]|uniref:DUF4412 domain-containing protein n=1 Tax=Puia sp. TaxID=2045100 RepID=UPI002F403A81